MQKTFAWLLLAGFAATSVGCTSTAPISRGQSHAGPHAGHPYAGPQGCPTGDCRGGAWGQPGGHGGYGPGGYEAHGAYGQQENAEYKQCYKAPRGLRYPPADVPPTFQQYPYYTLRGPTDFFME